MKRFVLVLVISWLFSGLAHGEYWSRTVHNLVSDNGAFTGVNSIAGSGTTPRLSGFTFGAAGATDNGIFNQSIVTTDNITTANIGTLNVTGVPTLADNTLNGADLIDNTVAIGKISATGTRDNTTILFGDGRFAVPSTYSIPYSYRNLIVTTVADNQNVDIDADYVITSDTSLNFYRATSVNLTVDLATTGANGLDNGSIAANTGYYLYVIYNGTTVAGLASTSATAPVMPSGYTYKALVSWATTDNTATPFNIEEFIQLDDEYVWSTGQELVDNGGSTTTASLSLASGGVKTYAVLPPNIVKTAWGKSISHGNTNTLYMNGVTFANTMTVDQGTVEHQFTHASAQYSGPWSIRMRESQTIYYQVSLDQVHLWLSGFTLKR